MKLPADYEPEFESLKGLLLEMAKERSVNGLLKMIVQRLAERTSRCPSEDLVDPTRGHLCIVSDADRVSDKTSCLHLVASAGPSHRRNRSGLVSHRW